MKNILTVLALAITGAMPIAATAADPGASGRTELPAMFKELDQDKDGQISKDEAKRSAEVQTNFDSMDTDRNGKISLIEWGAADKTNQRPKQ